MLAKTQVVQGLFLLLSLVLGAVQSGCSTSGTAEAPASNNTTTIRMTLSTTTGFTAIVADGRSTIPIRLQVTNGSGGAVIGVPVTFGTDAGTLTEAVVVRTARAEDSVTAAAAPRIETVSRVTVTTDSSGVAQALLRSSVLTGFATVTTDLVSNGQNFRTNIVIEFVPGPPAHVSLDAASSSVSAAASSVLTATVTDANGNPTPDETVTFAISTNTSGGSLNATSSVTDENGTATVTYTAGLTQGTDTVQARVTSTGVVGSTSLTVTAPSGPAAQVVSITAVAGAASIPADGRTPVAIRATVTGTAGPLVGTTVAFTTTAGSLSAATALTDMDGVATVSLIAASSLGSATVTATAGGFSETVVVEFVAGSPVAVVLTAPSTAVAIGGTITIQAAVTDTTGNPVPAQTLVFSLAPTSTSGGTLTPLSGMTDANGQVTVSYAASAVAGTDTVQARTTNGLTGTLRLTVTPVAGVTAIAVVAGAASIPADGRTSVAIRATVTGTAGPLVGTTVAFSTTAGSLSAATALTDTSGVATVNLIAASSLGAATVTATAGSFRATVTVAFVAGAPATVVLTAPTTSVVVGGTIAVQAAVTDATGNPVSAQTLVFSLAPTSTSGGTLTPLSGMTDANGQVTVSYAASAVAGTDTVQARTTNGLTGTLRLTVTPVAGVTAIAVVAGAASIPADGRTSVAIRATVTGTAGPLVGTTVAFSTTAGSLSAATALTDTSGVATVNLIAASSLGAATVTATAGGFSTTVTVAFVAGAPATVVLAAPTTSVAVGGTIAVQAAVTDATGNPVSAQTLVFSLASTSTSGGTLTPLSGMTDASGRLTVSYAASAVAGTDTVQARTTNGLTGTLRLTVTPIAGVTRIDLLVSSPQLGSDGTGSVTLTALVRNAANNVVSGVPVDFSADSGGIQVTNDMTEATGTATALLTAGGDRNNRVINVTARTGNLTSTNIVQVTGTTLTISGASTLALGGRATLTILLRDSGGQGISQQQVAVSSMLGNTLSATSVTTDSTGQQSVDVTASVAGNDTIQVSALGATASAAFSVSTDNFVFGALPTSNQVSLQSLGAVTVHWDRNGANQSGQNLTFSLTRGSFSAILPCPTPPISTTSAATDGNGNVTVSVCSDNAGPSVISATAGSAGPSAQASITFVASTPALLVLQASPTTVGVNDPGTTTQQSVITAVVRDAAGNLVANQQVNFSLTDVSGGQIFPASAATDAFGRASTIYTSGAAPSAQDGVLVTAVLGGVSGQATLTVARQALFVTLGTGNLINTPTSTQYGQPYSVLVNDANGNPITNATVELNARPTRYEKGFYSLFFDSNGACTGWGKVRTVRGTMSPDDGDQACDNEDANRNGTLDSGEDFNSNGILDLRIVVSVPQTVLTDATGFAFFDVTYAREFTWVEIELEARTSVQGSEATTRARFFLNGIASDFTNCNVSPPGQVSAFGIATTCICDERTDPATCPIFTGTTPVRLTTGTTTLPQIGGTFNFTVSGGTQTVYNLSTTGGTLSALSVNFGQSFALFLGPNLTGTPVSITVTATDAVTSQPGTITLTQLP